MRSLALAVCCCLPLALSACNTVAGFGEDVSAAGHAVANSADQVMGKTSEGSGSSVPAPPPPAPPPPPAQ